MAARLILRNDNDWVDDDVVGLNYTLNRGEVGAYITDEGRVEVRVGVENAQPFDVCPIIGDGEHGVTGLAADTTGLADLAVLTWDGAAEAFATETTTIEFPTNATGALAFDAAQSRFVIDTTTIVPGIVDGGLYNEGAEAPEFIVEPTIGVAE